MMKKIMRVMEEGRRVEEGISGSGIHPSDVFCGLKMDDLRNDHKIERGNERHILGEGTYHGERAVNPKS